MSVYLYVGVSEDESVAQFQSKCIRMRGRRRAREMERDLCRGECLQYRLLAVVAVAGSSRRRFGVRLFRRRAGIECDSV